jgi:glutaminyl-tRNA synthetase
MRAGEFADGTHVLRAKIDMSASNMKMRDPLLYRIRHAHHYRTGDEWPIYPMYDFAHCLEDAVEKITHSICTLEFENNRDVYDWVVDNVELGHKRPHQFEFARLNLNYTVMSKRKLLQLVQDGLVNGWDDPRMPTISGLRRRGYTPESIRNFANMIGVAKTNSMVDVSLLEYSIRDDLNHKAPRVMGVLEPLKLVITNYTEGEVENLTASLWPHDVPNEGERSVPFTRELYIERADFMESPVSGFNRLAIGREVRLRYAYFIRGSRVMRSDDGEIIGVECTYDRATKGGDAPDGRKVKGTIHWVSATEGVEVPVNLYDRLFCVENPAGEEDFKAALNPDSLKTITAVVEPYALTAKAGDHLQFERNGYFFVDPVDSSEGSPVFNRVVTLKSGWDQSAKKGVKDSDTKVAAKPKQGVAGRSRTEQLQYLFEQDPPLKVRYNELCSIEGVQEAAAGVIAVDAGLYGLFQDAVAVSQAAGAVAKWVANEVVGALKGRELSQVALTGASLGALVKLIEDGSISGKIAKGLFEELVESGGDPVDMVESRGLSQVSDETLLAAIIDDVLANNTENVEKFRGGNSRMKGFFVGQVMKKTAGKANPSVVSRLLEQKLSQP